MGHIHGIKVHIHGPKRAECGEASLNVSQKHYEETILDFEGEATFKLQDRAFSTLYVPLSCTLIPERLLLKSAF